MQGLKLDDKTKEILRQKLASGETAINIAKDLDIAKLTVYKYLHEFENDPDFIDLKRIKRQELIEQISANVDTATRIIGKKLQKIENEDTDEKASVLQVATTLGIMVEKLQLIQGQATSIVGGEIGIDIKTKQTIENAFKRLGNE
jgi:hypothetical protein